MRLQRPSTRRIAPKLFGSHGQRPPRQESGAHRNPACRFEWHLRTACGIISPLKADSDGAASNPWRRVPTRSLCGAVATRRNRSVL